MFWNFIYIVFIIVCIFLVITVLLQPGKGGGLGAAFGGGGNTVFGASGGTPVFRRMTTGAAIVFMLLSLLMSWHAVDRSVSSNQEIQKSRGLEFDAQDEMLEIPQPAAEALIAPAAPAPAPVEAAPAPAPVEAAPALQLPPPPSVDLQIPSDIGLGGTDANPALPLDLGIAPVAPTETAPAETVPSV